MAPERPRRRNETLSDSLAATFRALNWVCFENGTTHPEPNDGVSTLMGPPRRENDDDDYRDAIMSAVVPLREGGYTIQVIPDYYEEYDSEDYDSDSEGGEANEGTSRDGHGGQEDARLSLVVGKALCTYANGEMGTIGPTLELIEVAEEWQCHGLGSFLIGAITKHFRCVFADMRSVTRVLFSVCYVTNAYACMWFQRKHHFLNLDGMGEELGKGLFPFWNEDKEEDESDDEE